MSTTHALFPAQASNPVSEPAPSRDEPVAMEALTGAQALESAHAASDWRGWLRLLLEAIATSIAIALCLALTVLLSVSVAHAQPIVGTDFTINVDSPTKRSQAALFFETDQGFVPAPLQRSDVTLRVTGHIVRALVAQTYANPGDVWMQGTYRFPLPDDSAVDSLRMQVGDQTIEGRIEPRAVAKRKFETARQAGNRASLLTQDRPNVFTAAVANIAPRSEVTIQIEYQQVLKLDSAGWKLRFPTVVAPRYTPATEPDSLRLSPVNFNAQEDDAARILSAVHDLAFAPAVRAQSIVLTPDRALVLVHADETQNRLNLAVTVDAGVGITAPVSDTHEVSVATHDAGGAWPSYRIALTGDALSDRDFELTWAPLPQQSPQASLQIEMKGGQWYGLLAVAPPAAPLQTRNSAARETVFIIDTSGSMHGILPKAKEALAYALERLRPTDRFNIIEFNSTHRALFPKSAQADAQQLDTARRFLKNLRADGGTEMMGALREALQPSIPAGYLSQIVFITDGAVSNEQTLFDQIEALLGKRRLFTVGLGTAPNGWFMRNAAAAGRGTATMIGNASDVGDRMKKLFDQITYPMLTDVKLRDGDGRLLATGAPIRDLYADEPILHTFRLDAAPVDLFIEGVQEGQTWQDQVAVRAVEDRGIDKLWARDEIDTLSDRIRRAAAEGINPDTLREQATLMAMNHHLVSDYTSLVAIDMTAVRMPDSPSVDSEVTRQLPKGWNSGAHYGTTGGQRLAQTDTGLVLKLLTGALLLLAAVGAIAMALRQTDRLLANR